MERRDRKLSALEKPITMTLARRSSSASSRVSHADGMDPGRVDENTFLVIFPKPVNSSLSFMRKTPDKFKLRDSLQTTWLVLLKTVEVIKNKGSLRNWQSLEGPKDTDAHMSRALPGSTPEQKKDTRESRKSDFVALMYPYWFINCEKYALTNER